MLLALTRQHLPIATLPSSFSSASLPTLSCTECACAHPPCTYSMTNVATVVQDLRGVCSPPWAPGPNVALPVTTHAPQLVLTRKSLRRAEPVGRWVARRYYPSGRNPTAPAVQVPGMWSAAASSKMMGPLDSRFGPCPWWGLGVSVVPVRQHHLAPTRVHRVTCRPRPPVLRVLRLLLVLAGARGSLEPGIHDPSISG